MAYIITPEKTQDMISKIQHPSKAGVRCGRSRPKRNTILISGTNIIKNFERKILTKKFLDFSRKVGYVIGVDPDIIKNGVACIERNRRSLETAYLTFPEKCFEYYHSLRR